MQAIVGFPFFAYVFFVSVPLAVFEAHFLLFDIDQRC